MQKSNSLTFLIKIVLLKCSDRMGGLKPIGTHSWKANHALLHGPVCLCMKIHQRKLHYWFPLENFGNTWWLRLTHIQRKLYVFPPPSLATDILSSLLSFSVFSDSCEVSTARVFLKSRKLNRKNHLPGRIWWNYNRWDVSLLFHPG